MNFKKTMRIYSATHKAEIEKFSYKWLPQLNQTIEEWIEQQKKPLQMIIIIFPCWEMLKKSLNNLKRI